MENKSLKKMGIATGVVASIPTLYFIVQIIVYLTTDKVMADIWKTLNWVAIGLYVVCLGMLLFILIYFGNSGKNTEDKQELSSKDQELLKKYKTKK